MTFVISQLCFVWTVFGDLSRADQPQGSVLGPLLYVLYTAELAKVVARHGLQMHQYVGDIQIYTYTTTDNAAFAVDCFATCLTDVEAWLRASRLRLNPTKTQVMWLGSRQQLAKLDNTHVHVLSSCVAVQDMARDLRVDIDSQLSLSAHVAAVCRSGYYQLRQLRQAVRLLSEDASKTLVQVFVSCRLDYCNSLFFGISDRLMNRLQSVKNATARLVTST